MHRVHPLSQSFLCGNLHVCKKKTTLRVCLNPAFCPRGKRQFKAGAEWHSVWSLFFILFISGFWTFLFYFSIQYSVFVCNNLKQGISLKISLTIFSFYFPQMYRANFILFPEKCLFGSDFFWQRSCFFLYFSDYQHCSGVFLMLWSSNIRILAFMAIKTEWHTWFALK